MIGSLGSEKKLGSSFFLEEQCKVKYEHIYPLHQARIQMS